MADDQWMHCRCKKMTCNSCQAERVALEDHADVYRDMATPNLPEVGANTISKFLSSVSPGNQGLIRFDRPFGPMGDHVFICWFNASVSDSTYNGRTEFSYATPLIVYRFAHKFMLNPSLINRQKLPERVLKQVYEAIEKGNARYSELYPAAQWELTAEETLKAWPDIDMEVVSRYHSNNHTATQHIIQVIQELLPSQVVLIFRHKPYKVVSIVCTADPGFVCMFDSQRHMHAPGSEDGAMLFYCRKHITYIVMMISRYQDLCFGFEGECDIFVLEKKHVAMQPNL